MIYKGYHQTLQIISETFKSWKVWRVRFQNGEEAVLFKLENMWMQRNEDGLDDHTLNCIGRLIDQFNPGIAFS